MLRAGKTLLQRAVVYAPQRYISAAQQELRDTMKQELTTIMVIQYFRITVNEGVSAEHGIQPWKVCD